MLRFNRVLVLCACCAWLVTNECLHAQLRGGAAADRPGLGGRIAARRDDRAGRPPLPTPAVAAAANAAAAAARVAQLTPQPNLPRTGAPAAAAGTLPRTNPLVNNPGNRNPALNPAAGDARVSNYGAYPNAAGLNPNLNSSGYGVNNPASNNSASNNLAYNNFVPNPVTTASATAAANVNRSISLPPNRLPYTGPGVLIRLSPELRGEVNYLVDGVEQMVVHSGEEQLLRLKGSFEVRFSRGVTAEGQSYGEGRYTISEGIYRFDVSDKGWELYREGDGSELTRRLEDLRQQASRRLEPDVQSDSTLNPERMTLESTELGAVGTLPRSAIAAPLAPSPAADSRRPAPPALPLPERGASKESAPTEAAGEETLPAPRSILEPN